MKIEHYSTFCVKCKLMYRVRYLPDDGIEEKGSRQIQTSYCGSLFRIRNLCFEERPVNGMSIQ